MSATVEFWGLKQFEALRGLARGEWEKPPKDKFTGKEPKAERPRNWDMCMNVFVMPSDADGRAWLAATTPEVSCALEVVGECGELLAIPRDALPSQGERADSSGWRIDVDGARCTARRLSRGFTGKVSVGKVETVFDQPDTSGWRGYVGRIAELPQHEDFCEGSALPMAQGLNAVASTLEHWFYWPCTLGVDGSGRNLVAYSDDVDNRVRMKCAAREPHWRDKRRKETA